jgi:PAS domain S-box-containing protein
MNSEDPLKNEFYFLSKSETAEIIKNADWTKVSIGGPHSWPVSLRSMLGILFNSKLPMFIWWGQEHLQFYNDASFHSFFDQHPAAGSTGPQNKKLWNLFSAAVTNMWQGTDSEPVAKQGIGQQQRIVFGGKVYTFNYSPLYGDSGKLEGVVGICSDFEERVQELRSLIEAAPFPIGVYEGPEMRIRMVNQAIIDVWGKGADLVGKSYFEVLPELENQEIYPLLLNVFKTGEAFHAKNERVDIKVNGRLQTFYFNYSFTPLFDDTGNVYGVMNTAADVTDLNVTKIKMAQSQENFRNLIMQAPVSMCLMLGPSHTVEVANEHMINLWGKDREEVMFKPIFDGLPDAREQGLEAVLAKVFSSGETFTASEMPVHLIRFGQPDVVYQNFIYEPYIDGSGEILGVIAITNDVTEQVLARQKVEELIEVRTEMLLQSNESLARSNADLAQFAYIASHDLQEPLRKISMFSQMLEDNAGPKMDSRSQEQLRKISRSALRMQALVKDVLAYSQLNKSIDTFIITNLNDVLEGVMSDFELIIEEKGAVIEVFKLPAIPGQPLQLAQLFSNLIGNALKFQNAHSSPKISITSDSIGKEESTKLGLNDNIDYVKIIVSDNGVGFMPEQADKIFNIFHRLHSKTQFEGTGIGLSICKKIVDNHNGVINADGSSERGARFNIYLPLYMNER